MLEVRTQLQWNGARVQASLFQKLHNGVKNAVQLYYDQLQKELSKWGSVPFSGNYRLRVNHSSPGSAPLRQTSNLYNSLFPDIENPMATTSGATISGSVSTDVEYAPTLELGGSINSGPNKSHTTIRLINPIHGTISIAPRPAWIPAFMRNIPKMINHIKRG